MPIRAMQLAVVLADMDEWGADYSGPTGWVKSDTRVRGIVLTMTPVAYPEAECPSETPLGLAPLATADGEGGVEAIFRGHVGSVTLPCGLFADS